MEHGAELRRMETVGHPEASLDEAGPWWTWGPYLSERAWGSVREDYSADGNAWDYFPHDHARSRSYRWNEDGLAGLSTMRQDLCFALAFWNGEDPILKERIFGLGGPEGNHGEDAKEYWWYLDATPSHSYLHWRYHYPQGEFPYADLVRENASRDRGQPEYELLDTGAFDEDRYWTIDATYAKADATDLYLQIRVTNEGPDAATLHVLPHLWFRDTWSWGVRTETPQIRVDGGPDGDIVAEHPRAGTYRLAAAPGPDGDATHRIVLRQRDQRAAGLRARGRACLPQGRHQRPRGLRCGDGEPRADRHQVRLVVPPGRTSRGDPRAPAAPLVADRWRPVPHRLVRSPLRRGARRPEGRGRRVLRRPRSRRNLSGRSPGRAAGARRPDLGQAVLPVRPAAAGWTATRDRRPRRTVTGTAATRAGGTSTPTTSSRCRTRGSTHGSRPGTSPSRPWPSRTSRRRSRSTSCCSCAASGSCTPTAPSPPTSGPSTTSTRRCTPGRRSRCSASTGQLTTRSSSASSRSCCSTSPGGSTGSTPRATTSSRAGSWGWTTSGPSIARTSHPAPGSTRPTAPPGWRSTP